MALGLAYYLRNRYTDAATALEQSVERASDNVFAHVVLAASYAKMDRTHKATQAAQRVLQLRPFFLVKDFGPQFRDPADAERVQVGLRKAGLK